ncbi:DNA repair helicase [Lentinus brumalis]|uniref:ATP-dependent DNA helicase CHL1 n=1 Tax=Lentinus brumalis TaxID=2498619 RepID=A0A371D4Y2_9APHY|nr:DNA repair helicase [Polyporus brumalis]
MSLRLPTPTEFPAFPFKPYDIQSDLMRQVYDSIEDHKVAIMESPTGTGKTLSLLCSSLTWLKDEQCRARNGKLDLPGASDAAPDWVLAQTIDRRRRQLEAEEIEYAQRLADARKREAQLRRLARGHVRKKPGGDQEAAFLPDGDADEETSNISPAVLALMRKLQQGPASQDSEKEPTCTKIYYASRTHSQLSQVLHELHKLKIKLNVALPDASEAHQSRALGKRSATVIDEDENVEGSGPRAVSLGSRKQLCIHERLREKVGDLDEACRQMLGEKGKKRCPHLPTVEEETRMLDLRDQILATPKDVEDLFHIGQAADVCPYFGSRRAIPQAQLVLLPYNLLLQKTAREALGIDLTNQVVIIDEGHNLTSTLLSLSTTRLPMRTLANARHQLSIYMSRFRNRLSTMHSLHLKRLMNLLDALAKYAEEWRDEQLKPKAEQGRRGPDTEVMTSGELMQKLGRKAEGINLLEVEKYLRESKIARKISGYSVKELENAAGQDKVKLTKIARLANTTPPLHAVESFIMALTTASEDGRVTFSMVDGQVEIKYQHLNPATHFQEVIEVARSVILAGGTMSPMSDVVNQLFSGLPKERLVTFSCGHIIPESNLQTLVMRKGPRGGELQFKFQQRGDDAVLAELGQILLNFASIVPAGMVVFVPSYGFLHAVTEKWKTGGVLDKLNAKKKVFSEPQDSTQVETVLRDYAATIRSPSEQEGKKRGALLFAVVGAKLSEGLNFTDDLARAVIIVGLPFANLGSPELKERMSYVNRLEQRRLAAGGTRLPGAKDAGTELYENMCMNAVNQSIGRAIRHRGDWAALILVDCRYASPRIREKLPKWIESGTIITETFGQAMKELGKFYRNKREAVPTTG